MSAPALEIPIKADGVDDFKNQMADIGRSAGDAVGHVESAFENLKPGISGLIGFGTAIGGSVAAVMALQAALKGVNSQLASIGEAAKLLATTSDEVQKLQFAGASVGIGGDQALSDLQNVGKLLNDAKNNETSLTKLLAANNVAYKDREGNLISINQLLAKGADLIRNAGSFADKIEIAKMLGLTKEWVPALEQGGQAFQAIADSATDAGAVINSDVIDRATQFDDEWRKSSTEFSLYMRASLSGLLPILDDLLDGAAKFVQSIDKQTIQSHADKSLKALSDATGLPNEGGIKIGITPDTEKALTDFRNASPFTIEFWEAAGRALVSSVQFLRASDVNFAQGVETSYSDTSPQALNSQFTSQSQWQDQVAALKKMQGDVANANSNLGKPTVLPTRGGDSNDSVDNALNSLNRHIQQTEADTRAIGLGAAALAKFRAEAEETAAVQKNGGQETAEQAAQFKKLQEQAGAAADALAKAKINSDISFGKQTAFLSDEDVAVAEKLRTIYGDNVPAALASSQAAALKLNTAFRGLSSSIENDLTSGLTDIVSGTKSVSQGFSDMAASVLKDIEQMVIKLAVVEPIMKGISGAFRLGGGSTAAASAFPGFAAGTDAAPGGLAWVGERGPELVRLPRGTAVYPHEESMALARDIPKFADGGIVGSPGMAAPLVGHQTTIAPSIAVTVQGSPGMSQQDHARMGQTIAAQIQPALEGMMQKYIRGQQRPGGSLFRR